MTTDYGIIFDYNGVLVDDEHLHYQTMAETVALYGVDLDKDYYYHELVGKTDEEQIKILQEKFSAELSAIKLFDLMLEKTRLYQDILPTANIIVPEVPALLAELNGEFKIGLVSGCRRKEIDKVLQRHNLKKYFEFTLTSEDVSHSKPDPEGYLKGLEKMGVNADKTVVVEDTTYGVQAAKAAGLKCIAVLTTTPKEKLQEAGADLIIGSVSQLDMNAIKGVFMES